MTIRKNLAGKLNKYECYSPKYWAGKVSSSKQFAIAPQILGGKKLPKPKKLALGPVHVW